MFYTVLVGRGHHVARHSGAVILRGPHTRCLALVLIFLVLSNNKILISLINKLNDQNLITNI